jgi:hypothetical protein
VKLFAFGLVDAIEQGDEVLLKSFDIAPPRLHFEKSLVERLAWFERVEVHGKGSSKMRNSWKVPVAKNTEKGDIGKGWGGEPILGKCAAIRGRRITKIGKGLP